MNDSYKIEVFEGVTPFGGWRADCGDAHGVGLTPGEAVDHLIRFMRSRQVVRYRPHRGGALSEEEGHSTFAVNNIEDLVRVMHESCGDLLGYFPRKDRPNVDNITIEPYGKEFIVLVNGEAWGYLNRPL